MTASPSSPLQKSVSPAEWLALQSASEQRAFLATFDPQERAALEYQWRGFWARPKQESPTGDWLIWLILAGRGFGKSRTGAEWIREQVGSRNKPSRLRIALVARTAADVRDVIVEGESGILAISPAWNRPKYEPSKRRLTWPNGAMATTYSADKPDQMRGPQYHIAWCDELAAWRYEDAWTQLRFGNRLPNVVPKIVVTTTPRPTKIVREILGDERTTTTKGSTFENAANLAPDWLQQIRKKYDGTRLGRQELHAEILDDTPGALWKRKQLEDLTVTPGLPVRDSLDLERIVVAIDPAVTSGEGSDETGIIVAGIDGRGDGYVLEDLSGRHSPDEWARIAVKAYHTWQADRIVAEVNNGGDLVEKTIRTVDDGIAYRAVRAAKGKYVRAEPVAALYEQQRVHHVGSLPELEDQMCTWVPGQSKRSPDRLDALVWGITDLMIDGAGHGGGATMTFSGR